MLELAAEGTGRFFSVIRRFWWPFLTFRHLDSVTRDKTQISTRQVPPVMCDRRIVQSLNLIEVSFYFSKSNLPVPKPKTQGLLPFGRSDILTPQTGTYLGSCHIFYISFETRWICKRIYYGNIFFLVSQSESRNISKFPFSEQIW